MLFNNNLLVNNVDKAKELCTQWVNETIHDQVLSTSVFCLGDATLASVNLKLLFTALRNKFTELGIGFARTAESEILKFIKQKYSDRITLNGSTENCIDGKVDVLSLTIRVNDQKPPVIVLQHYHSDKLNSFKIRENTYVAPVTELHALVVNSQEAYDYFSRLPSLQQISNCLLLSEILDTQRKMLLRVPQHLSYFSRGT